MRRRMVRCISKSLHFLNMENYHASINVSSIWGKPRTNALILMNTKKIISLILFSGKIVVTRMVITIGTVHGARGGLAGTLSVRR